MIEIDLRPARLGLKTKLSILDADIACMPWRANKSRRSRGAYVLRFWRIGGGKKASEYLHRVVARRMGLDIQGCVVDHINGDTLDNRRENLRVVSRADSVRNTAGPYSTTKHGTPGVYFTPEGTWQASIGVNGKRKYLGRFKTHEEAVAARLRAEKEIWGVQPRRAWEHGS